MGYKHTYDTIYTHFQGIYNNIYGFGRPFLLLHFLPVHPYFCPSVFVFTHPNDGWTGLYIKLCYSSYIRTHPSYCCHPCIKCLVWVCSACHVVWCACVVDVWVGHPGWPGWPETWGQWDVCCLSQFLCRQSPRWASVSPRHRQRHQAWQSVSPSDQH